MLKRIIVGAGIAAIGWATYSRAQRWRTTWGVDPDEGLRSLPGDDVIESPVMVDTRGIAIDAPAELVWPWLVQMGYGRGGWYSIDQLDMRGSSADRIVDAWQALAVGDLVPTHPGGGFTVKALEPGRSLVLYADSATMIPVEEAPREEVPLGLAASGALLSASQRDFAGTWTFVVEPLGQNRTRFIERLRYWGPEGSAASRMALPFLGFGVFVMMQRQMVGIRTRAERLARGHGQTTVNPGNGPTAEFPETVLATAGPG